MTSPTSLDGGPGPLRAAATRNPTPIPTLDFRGTAASTSGPATGPLQVQESQYVSGVCNIGPAEIAARRRFGHIGFGATVVLLAVLVLAGAPPLLRLVIALPAAASAVGYLQAALHFCAGFGSRGVFNFGKLGNAVDVADPAARARDVARSRQIFLASLAIGIAAGVLAALLPL